jgi:hypothetical protein
LNRGGEHAAECGGHPHGKLEILTEHPEILAEKAQGLECLAGVKHAGPGGPAEWVGDIAESQAAFFWGVDAADDCAQGNFAGFGKGPEAVRSRRKEAGRKLPRRRGNERFEQSAQGVRGKNHVIVEHKDVGNARIFQCFGCSGFHAGPGPLLTARGSHATPDPAWQTARVSGAEALSATKMPPVKGGLLLPRVARRRCNSASRRWVAIAAATQGEGVVGVISFGSGGCRRDGARLCKKDAKSPHRWQ